MQKSSLLFDFDGTVVDTTPTALETIRGICKQQGWKGIVDEQIQTLRTKGWKDFLIALGMPEDQLHDTVQKVRDGWTAGIENIPLIEHMDSTLRSLRNMCDFLGIVTTNATENVLWLLKKYGLADVFDCVESGSSIFGKGEILRVITNKKKLFLPKTYYVGDEVRDIVAACEANMQSIAVGWGVNDKETLIAAKPDHYADTPIALFELIKLNT